MTGKRRLEEIPKVELHLRIHRVTWPIRPTPCLHIAPQIHFQVPLEMCPLSNVSTRLVDGIESQPIRRYIDRGVLVTVNTDDPIMSGNSFVAEYQALVEVHLLEPISSQLSSMEYRRHGSPEIGRESL